MSKLKDAVIGLVVGDAFGVPYEFKPKGCLESDQMIGYGTHNQPAGTWSDDSSMVIATLAAFSKKPSNEVSVGDVMREFVAWYKDGMYTPYGRVFDCGLRTAKSIEYYMNTGMLLHDANEMENGNGSLMRILPFAFIPGMNTMAIDLMSSLTHPHEISKKICNMYVDILWYIIHNPWCTKHDVYQYAMSINFDMLIDKRVIEGIKPVFGDGYVVHTLEAALYSFYNTNSYKDAICTAVNIGDDTDTTAAVTGGLAGLYYGKDSIPKQWLETTVHLNDIEALCDAVVTAGVIQE